MQTAQAEAGGQAIYARLLPHNPRKGYKVARYCHWDGTLFLGGEKPNWYQVTAEQAKQLEPLRQEGPGFDDPDSKPLFQIVPEPEKLRIESEEQGRALQTLKAAAVTVPLPQGDLSGGRAAAIPKEPSIQATPSPPELPPVVVADIAATVPPALPQPRAEAAGGTITSAEVVRGRRKR